MLWSRVVVGVDFSSISTAAAHWVANSFAPGAELVLAHAPELPEPPEFLRARLPDHATELETQRRGAEVRLHELAAELGGRSMVSVRTGRPAVALADLAHELDAGLIVVGEHGRRKGIAGIMGSTAEELLHISPVPVLLLRVIPSAELETLLVPIDDAGCGSRVLDLAAEVARDRSLRVVLYHALRPGLVGRVELISTDRAAAEFEQSLIADARAWLERQAHARGLPMDRTALHVSFGAPAHEILALVERLRNPLIVMGSRCAGPVSRILLGSVARTVAHTAACPILMVREAT